MSCEQWYIEALQELVQRAPERAKQILQEEVGNLLPAAEHADLMEFRRRLHTRLMQEIAAPVALVMAMRLGCAFREELRE